MRKKHCITSAFRHVFTFPNECQFMQTFNWCWTDHQQTGNEKQTKREKSENTHTSLRLLSICRKLLLMIIRSATDGAELLYAKSSVFCQITVWLALVQTYWTKNLMLNSWSFLGILSSVLTCILEIWNSICIFKEVKKLGHTTTQDAIENLEKCQLFLKLIWPEFEF